MGALTRRLLPYFIAERIYYRFIGKSEKAIKCG